MTQLEARNSKIENRHRGSASWHSYLIVCVSIFALFLPTGRHAWATTLTGSFRNADGSAVANGRLLLRLRLPAVTKTSPQQVVNNTVVCSLDAAGGISGTCSVQDNANLTPAEYYVATLYDSNSNRLWTQNWYVTGASADVGTLQQTTMGISFPNPVVQNTSSAQSVQSAMTFSGNVTFSNPVSAKTLNNVRFADQFTAGSSTGGIQEAINEVSALGGGTVVLPFGVVTTTSSIIPKSKVNLVGHGFGSGTGAGTYIQNSTGDVFAANAIVTLATFKDFFVSSNAGGGHIFNWGNFIHTAIHIEHFGAVQNNAGKAIFYSTGASAGIIDSTIHKFFWYYLLGNTVPALYISSPTVTQISVEDGVITGLGPATGGTFAIHIESTAAGGGNLVSVKNVTYEDTQGGALRMLGIQDSRVAQSGVFDISTAQVNPLIRVAAGAGGAPSRRILFENIFEAWGNATNPSLLIEGDVANQNGFTIINSNLNYVKGGVSTTGSPVVVINSNIANKVNWAETVIQLDTVKGVFVSSTSNPASAGAVRLASGDAINFRNNAANADVNGIGKDTSDIVQVGGSAGARTVGPFIVNAGQQVSKILQAQAALTFGAISAQTCGNQTITVTGAATSNASFASPNYAVEAGLSWSAFVSAANTVTVRVCNVTAAGITPTASSNWRVWVIQE